MKKLFFVAALCCATVFSSCGKINDELDALGERLDKLEQETIPSIDEQIVAINTTLGNLDAMDKELDGYIKTLQTTASNLQEQINATNTKIDEVKAALQGEISTAKTEVLSQLNAVKAELEGELSQINSTIETLQAKDAELDQKIADLRTYVDDELKNTTDWAEATFATLEQYSALVGEVAVIKTQITSINNNISALETRLNEKISKDIAAAVSTLNSDIQQKVKSITDAYTDAVKSAKEDITEAYTAAIESAISTLETSMKSWVSEQLKGYYTIAEIDAKVATLNKQIEDGDESLAEELSKLKSSLEAAKKELTEAYEKAIEQAIEEHNGEITAIIASEINSVNQRINEEVATINSKLAALQSQIDKNSADISKLLARIQSLSYIPQYEDGKATVKYSGSTGCVTLDFEVSPKDAVAELAKVWQDALSVKAVYTQTRAVSFVDMPIVEFEADAENGVISVTASGENLSAEFFNDTQSASARLSISDGNNSVTSEYIPMVAKRLMPIVDVQFNNDGSATDKVKDYAITKETIGEGGEFSVSNGIATFGEDAANMTFYKIDFTQGDGALKTAMNNGFTIEVILSSALPESQWDVWACPFGGEGFRLIRLSKKYGAKWNINGWNTDRAWKYTDGTISPKENQYYHILYSYNIISGAISVYRNGVYENKNGLSFRMLENSSMIIGGAYDYDAYGNLIPATMPWSGNIASFRIYENAVDKSEAASLYKAVQNKLDALNGVAAE